MASSGSASPSARAAPFIASAGKLVYLWGGHRDTEPETVFIYRHDTETWMRQLTKGPHPPTGLYNGGCTILGNCLYIYGGIVEGSGYGDLCELNTKTWTWRKVCEGGSRRGLRGPGKKEGCRMISYKNKLLVVGGYSVPTPSRQESGRTNEIHLYNVATSKE